ncbi:unnamed protein product [Peniophora sp. CBMAI 1063]|nr:unnamed protein product [Peniophora sp. CBMAI 1063]
MLNLLAIGNTQIHAQAIAIMPPGMPRWILDLAEKPDEYLNEFRDGCSDDPYYMDQSFRERATHPPVGKCGELLRSSPSSFLYALVDLHTTRVRGGTNRELWQHVAALQIFLDSLDPAKGIEHPFNALVNTLIDLGLYSVLLVLLDDNDVFDEHPRYIAVVLFIIREITGIAVAKAKCHERPRAPVEEPPPVPIDSRIARLQSCLFKTAWSNRDVFDETHRNEAYVPGGSKATRQLMWRLCRHTQWSGILGTASFDEPGLLSLRRFILFLWATNPDIDESPNSDGLFCILAQTFTVNKPPEGVIGTATSFLRDELCPHYNPKYVVERISDTICSASTDDVIPGMMWRITWLVREMLIMPCFRVYLASSRVFETLCESINKYAEDHVDPLALWAVRRDGLKIIRNITHDVSFSEGAESFIRQGVVQFLARSVVNATMCNVLQNDPGWAILHDVLHQYTLIGGALRLRREKATGEKKQSLAKFFDNAIHDEWYPTLQALRPCPPTAARSGLLDAWKAFGDALGLDESEEKAAFERARRQFCSWAECEYHKQAAPMPTRQCAGCGQVRYCSKVCQQRDWKEGKHKVACKRLKGAPSAL